MRAFDPYHVSETAALMDNLLALPIGTELAGDYRIRQVLGAGGFGITYLAEETPLNRGVAIKEYFPSDFAAREGTTLVRSKSRSQDEDYRWGLERFIEEAQALATFDHANIVRVYRYFRQNNTGYMVLKLEEGRSFKAWLDGLNRRPQQSELDAIAGPLLQALETIHARSFLHRDIAPDNIMIRPDGTPVLIDFGSARREVANHMRNLSVLVKPGYSPVEQYAQDGRRQGPWSDIYALAATLYHAVTGKRPVDAPVRMQSDDLEPARTAAKGVYRLDFLGAIDAALRLPIEARPQSIAEWRPMLLETRAAKVPERKPAPAAKAAGRTRKLDGEEPAPIRLKPKKPVPPRGPSMPLSAPAASVARRRVDRAAPAVKATAAFAAAVYAQAKLSASDAQRWLLDVLPRRVPDPVPVPAPEPEQMQTPKPRPKRRGLIELLQESQPAAGATDPIRAAVAKLAPAAGLPAASDAVTQIRRPAPVSPPAVPRREPQPIPPREPSGTVSRRVGSRKALSLSRVVQGLLFRLVLIAAFGTAVVSIDYWGPKIGLTVPRGTVSAVTDVSLLRTLRGHAVAVETLTVSGDGTLIASAGSDGQILIWDGKTGAQLRSILVPGSSFTALASSEHVLLAGRADGSIGLWQMDSGAKLGEFDEHEGPVWSAAFLGSAKQFATAGQDAKLRLWDAGRGVRSVWTDHKKAVFAVAYSAHARLIASGGADKLVKLWDEKRRRLIRTYEGHSEDVRAVALSPDGLLLASASNDKTIMLWPTASDGKLRTLTGHTNRVVTVAFSPDGRLLASGSEDGTVRLWDASSGDLVTTYEGHAQAVRAVAFLPDGHHLASAGDDMTVRLWNVKIAGYP